MSSPMISWRDHGQDSYMRYRTFGRTGWQVSEIGYGMWGMGGWTGSDDEESLRALDRAFALGCNFFDTAWVYGAGKSEQLLGEALRAHPRRADRIVATKIPPKNMKWPGKAEYPVARHLSARPHPRVHREEPRRTSALDDDRPAAVPRLERRVGRRRRLAARGRRPEAREADPRVRHQRQPLGSRPTCCARSRPGSIDSVQVVYNIFDQAPEDELFPYCQAHDIAVIARVPFDEGSLTGTLTAGLDVAGRRLAEHLLQPGAPGGDAATGRPPRARWFPRAWTCPSWRCGSSWSTRRSARPFPACASPRTSSGTWPPATGPAAAPAAEALEDAPVGPGPERDAVAAGGGLLL